MLTNENYVKEAENAIKRVMSLKDIKGRPITLTTSKIRNILAMTADIYNDVINSHEEKLSQDIISRIQYLKIRTIYEAGRESAVKRFVEIAKLIDYIDEIKDSKENYILFSRYMEALVAYRKFAGNDD